MEDYAPLLQMEEPYRSQFASKLQTRFLAKDDYFLQVGEVAHYAGIVTTGILRTFHIDAKGHDTSFLFHWNGQPFTNYASMLTGEPSNLAVQALEDTEIQVMHKQELFALYETSMYWQRFGRQMAEASFIVAKKRIDDLLFYTPEERYLALLQENPDIFQKIQQKYIATYLGITPQSLSRIRKRIYPH